MCIKFYVYFVDIRSPIFTLSCVFVNMCNVIFSLCYPVYRRWLICITNKQTAWYSGISIAYCNRYSFRWIYVYFLQRKKRKGLAMCDVTLIFVHAQHVTKIWGSLCIRENIFTQKSLQMCETKKNMRSRWLTDWNNFLEGA